MEMDSTPQEKTEYELARDRRVAEVQKRMAPVVAALQEWEASKAKPKHVRFLENPTSNEAHPVRRSGRRLYSGGQEASKGVGREQIGKRGEETSKMSSARTTSSEATNTNDEDIATASEQRLVDSFEEDADLSDEEPLLIRRLPRKKNTTSILPPQKIPWVKLMFPSCDDEQDKIEDVKGTATLWDQKYLKAVA